MGRFSGRQFSGKRGVPRVLYANEKEKRRYARGFTQSGLEAAGAGLRPEFLGGPDQFARTFMGGSTSRTEGYIFWSFLALGMVENVDFSYQSPLVGGMHELGGAVVDFIVYQKPMNLGLRIVTYQWHHAQGSEKAERDFEQKSSLTDMIKVIDLYEQHFINDPSGKAAIAVLKDALAEVERPDPLSTGIVLDVS